MERPVRVHVKRGSRGRWHVWVQIPERWEPRGSYGRREQALAVARFEAGFWRNQGHPVQEVVS